MILTVNGNQQYVLLEYDIYLQLKKVIDEWRLVQQSQVAPQIWAAAMKQMQILEVLIASARISAERERNPASVVSHAELKRRLAEKKAAPEHQHVAA
jgi:hypothetical protein